MNAEELIIYIKDCINALNVEKYEPIITPTTGDPTELQNDVTIIVMERIGDYSFPKFEINVKDLEELRKLKHG